MYKFVRDVHMNAAAKQALYHVTPAAEYDYYDDSGSNYEKRHTSYVIVSAAWSTFSGPETYIFPADGEGNVLSWSELEGSYRGGLDHDVALAGY